MIVESTPVSASAHQYHLAPPSCLRPGKNDIDSVLSADSFVCVGSSVSSYLSPAASLATHVFMSFEEIAVGRPIFHEYISRYSDQHPPPFHHATSKQATKQAKDQKLTLTSQNPLRSSNRLNRWRTSPCLSICPAHSRHAIGCNLPAQAMFANARTTTATMVSATTSAGTEADVPYSVTSSCTE